MSHHGRIRADLPEVAVFVTLELSKSSWLIAAQAEPSGKTSSRRLSGGDVDGLPAPLRCLQAREERSFGQEAEIIL